MRLTKIIIAVLIVLAFSVSAFANAAYGKHTNTQESTDKTVKFLWRDRNDSIVINEEYCKTISAPEKAALGYVATFIGNECWWDGKCKDDRSNLKCKILTSLDLGYQCSEKHLGFLRQWFKNDTASLNELENCGTMPDGSTVEDTFNKIILTRKGNQILVFFRATGIDGHDGTGWNWSETDYFQIYNDNIKLIKKRKSKVKHESYDKVLRVF